MKKAIILSMSAVLVLSACGGRKPNPVAEIQNGDAALSCTELSNEITANSKAIEGLIAEKGTKTTQNIVAGTAGVFLLVPFFFMDLKGAAGDEARAYQRRNLGLVTRYNSKGCKPEIRIQEKKQAIAKAS